jgi:hypothetical protein
VREHSCGRTLLLTIIGLIGLCLIAGAFWWEGYLGGFLPKPLPVFPTVPPFTLWSTPPAATVFDFPLLPAEAYGPYVQGVTGPLAVDTRYGVQNPAMAPIASATPAAAASLSASSTTPGWTCSR